MGLYSGGLITGRIFASEIIFRGGGGLFLGGLNFFLGGGEAYYQNFTVLM